MAFRNSKDNLQQEITLDDHTPVAYFILISGPWLITYLACDSNSSLNTREELREADKGLH
jgi:hypothetical protein